MSRQGTIASIDPEQSAAAIFTDGRGYTVIEVDPQWPVAVGDIVEWDEDDALGFQEYRNISRGVSGDVFVQNHDLDEANLRLQFGI
jgi:sensor domain CHASE-containing protein